MNSAEYGRPAGEFAEIARPHASRRRLYLYLLPLIVLPILMLASAFWIVPTPWLAARSGNTNLANLGYGARLHNADCQVLVYGDSSAEVDFDPLQLQQQTGLTACNIAEFQGMSLVNGTEIVDRYLSHNPRPRFLVFLYTPDDLNFTKTWDSTTTFEGIVYRLQYERNRSTLGVLAAHPKHTFAFAEQGLRMLLTRFRTQPFGPEVTSLRDRTRGKFTMHAPAMADCRDMERETAYPDADLVHSMRTHFGVEGTTVLVDATPTADCDRHLPFFREHLAGLVDNLPYPAIPLSSFVADGQYHTGPEGTRLVTGMIAEQIRTRLALAQTNYGVAPGGR